MEVKEYPATLIRRQDAFSRAFELAVTDPTKEDFNELHFAVKFESHMVIEASHQRGKWIWKKDNSLLRTYDLLCSKCGYKIFTCENYDSIEQAQKSIDDLVKNGKKMPNYCSECGSDNRKKEEITK